MAKLKRGLLGGFSGKIANIVGTNWKGIEAMRSLPLSVANPNTPEQQAQRGAFSQVVAVAQMALTGAIKPLWDSFVSQQSGFNGFIQANIAAFDQNGLATPADLLLSRGSYTGVDSPVIEDATGAATMDVTWSSTGGNADDEVYVFGYNETQDEYVEAPLQVLRSAQSASPSFPTNPAPGDTLHAWIGVRRNDGRAVSTGQHASVTLT